MMKYPDSLPPSVHLRGRERGFTLIEILMVIALIGLLVAIGFPMMRRTLVRAEMMGQVKMLQQAINVSRMRAIKDGEWVVLELLHKDDGVWQTPPLGLVYSWVDNNRNRRYNQASEELVHKWYLNIHTAILKEGGNRRLYDLRARYKGIVFMPTGIAIATKAGVPGVGRGSVIVEDQFGNRIRLQVWSSAGTVQLTMWNPYDSEWSDELRFWRY